MSLDEKLRTGRLSRRDFIRLGIGGMASLALSQCKSPAGTEPPKMPEPVSYTGTIRGLIRDTPISSGEITFKLFPTQPQPTKVPIQGGVFIITPAHKLQESTYEVLIETNEGYPRQTRAMLSNQGLFQEKTKLPVDNVIEYNSGYDFNTYNDFQLAGYGSWRWLSNKPRFFIYDKSLWSGKSGKLEVIDSNYNMSPQTIANVEYVVANHIHLFTNNFVSGQLYKESNSTERPDPRQHPTGWILYFDREDAPYSITQGLNESQGDASNHLKSNRRMIYLVI